MKYTTYSKDITPNPLNGFFVGWLNPPSPDVHLELLEKSSHFVLVMDEQSDQVVGFISTFSGEVLSAYIPFLEVLPSYQEQGIGHPLVVDMFDLLQDIYMIDLMCDKELQGYYEKLGMQLAHGMIRRHYA